MHVVTRYIAAADDDDDTLCRGGAGGDGGDGGDRGGCDGGV